MRWWKCPLARNFGGNENSTEDMSQIIKNLDDFLQIFLTVCCKSRWLTVLCQQGQISAQLRNGVAKLKEISGMGDLQMSTKSVLCVTESWFLEILAMVDGQFRSRSQTQGLGDAAVIKLRVEQDVVTG